MKNNLFKKWRLQKAPDGYYVVVGEIYNDEKKRFKDGNYMRTSRIKSIDFETGIAITKNSVYNLEKWWENE